MRGWPAHVHLPSSSDSHSVAGMVVVVPLSAGTMHGPSHGCGSCPYTHAVDCAIVQHSPCFERSQLAADMSRDGKLRNMGVQWQGSSCTMRQGWHCKNSHMMPSMKTRDNAGRAMSCVDANSGVCTEMQLWRTQNPLSCRRSEQGELRHPILQ